MQLLVSVLRRALSSLRGPRWRRLAWTLIAAFAAVVLVGAALLCGRTATGWMRAGQGGAQLIVYLTPDTEEAPRQSLVDDLAALGGVTRVELVEPAEALRRLRAALAGEQQLLDGVEPETMPASIEAELAPGVDAVLPMSPTLSALRRHPAVEDVVIEPAPPDTLGAAMAGVAPWARSLTLLVAGLAALLCFAVARLAWAVPPKELAVARLLGAGPAFHVVPLALSAAVSAALGALLGVVALLAGGLQVTSALAGPTVGSDLAVLGAGDAALLVLAAALIGGAGAARAAVAGEPAGG
jgi:cell division transport system permease protein